MSKNDEFDRRLKLVEQSVERYGKYLTNYLYGLTKQWHDAESLCNDLFICALHKFPEDKILNIGLLRFRARQLFYDYWRKRRRMNQSVISVEEPPEMEYLNPPEEELNPEQDSKFKERFFSEYPVEIPTLHKDALWLHARHGYTYKEISEILGQPASTIGDWITRSRKLFADYINQS